MTESSETSAPVARCANCGAPLHGNFCYACGQPVKGLIRHLSGIVGDFLDSVLSLDSRTFRTLAPLFFRPGYLAIEYFAGRRVRYVTPLRLFFFMSVIAFFSVQLYLEQTGFAGKSFIDNREVYGEFSDADTPQKVQEVLDQSLAQLQAAMETSTAKQPPSPPEAAAKILADTQARLRKKEDRLRKKAAERLKYVSLLQEAKAKGLPLPADPSGNDGMLSIDGTPWDAKTHPLHVDWLPEIGNAKLNEMAGNIKTNILRAKDDPKRLLLGLFGVLPATLFVLMPLFAVLLKILYLFKRRLYMEHLIVALQSHAFIFFALLLLSLSGLLGLAVVTLAPGTRVLMFAIAWWIPIYLLLMQRRVYKQNWFMTIVKFSVVGICYSVMIGIAISIALVLSLTAKA